MDLSQEVKNQALVDLQSSVGWKIISDELNSLIPDLQERINALDLDMTMKQLWKLKVSLYHLKLLLELPEMLKGNISKVKEVLIDETYET